MKKVFAGIMTIILLFSLCGGTIYAVGVADSEARAVSATGGNAVSASIADGDAVVAPASATGGDAVADLTGGIVTSLGYERAFCNLEDTIQCFAKEDLSQFRDILVNIQDVLICTVLLPNGEDVDAMCTASWDTTFAGLDKAGIYDVVVTLSPPDGCTFGADTRTQIVLPIQILDEAAPVDIVKIAPWSEYSLAFALPQGGNVDLITSDDLFAGYSTDDVMCKDENGAVHFADISWDFGTLDVNTVGVYTIVGTVVAPFGTTFASGLPLPQPTASISVQSADKPDINCFYLWFPNMTFPWVTSEGELDNATIWLSEDDAAWQELTKQELAGVTEKEVWITTNMFAHGKNYRIQVDYNGGQTGIFSFFWDDNIVINGYQEGDRDGDDGSDKVPPGIIQPPPAAILPPNSIPTTPPPPTNSGDNSGNSGKNSDNNAGSDAPPTASNSTPTPPPATSSPTPADNSQPIPGEKGTAVNSGSGKATSANSGNAHFTSPPAPTTDKSAPTSADAPAFMEESSATRTVISGIRLRLMLEEDENLQFFKQGVSVTIQREAVDALNIADNDKFSIEITQKSDNDFSFSVLLNDIEIEKLAGTSISLKYKAKSDKPILSLQNASQETIANGSYEPLQGIASFTVDTAGQYFIWEEMPASADPVARVPIWPFVLGAGCVAGIIGGFWLFKKGSRK